MPKRMTEPPWKRTTSPTTRSRRSTSASPPWGPAPVTMVPRKMASEADATMRRPIQRTSGETEDRAGVWGWPARWCSTTAFQMMAMDSRKWAITNGGDSSTSTVMPPRTIWPIIPATRPSDHQVRSRRRGVRTSDPRTASITATESRPVNVRFTNSTMAWYSTGATIRLFSQVGQSVQPRPDPVRRTAPPVTTITESRNSATRVIFL